jgi:hypothetical protein
MLLRVLVAAAVVVLIASESGPARADAAEVETLIAKGNDLRREGKPGTALPYFQKAYDIARTPRTASQLGLAELAVGYPVEAAEHLATALESPSDPSVKRFRKMLTDALTMARSQIGEVTVRGTPSGAEVVVNGRAVGTLPLSSPIKLAPSNTELAVRAPGFSERREVIRVTGGQRYELTFNLEPTAKAAEAAKQAAPAVTVTVNPPPVSAPSVVPLSVAPGAVATAERSAVSAADANAGSGLRTTAWIAGGAAVAALGAGLALNLAAISTLNEFNGSCKIEGGKAVQDGGSLNDGQCIDRNDTFLSQKRWSHVGYISGAALAVTSGVLFWTSRSPSPEKSAHFTCAPTLNGLTCRSLW